MTSHHPSTPRTATTSAEAAPESAAESSAGSSTDVSNMPVLHCSSTADFLAALPFLTGFTADESLFLVMFAGKRSTQSVRIDLPRRPDEHAVVIDALCTLLREFGAASDRPAIVITTRESFAESRGTPWRRFARAIDRRFTREGWHLRELAIVARDGWGSVFDPDTPRGGRSLDEISASPIAAQAGDACAAPRPLDELAQLPPAGAARQAEIIACLADLDEVDELTPADECHGARSERLIGFTRVATTSFAVSGDAHAPLEPRLCARLIRAAEHQETWIVMLYSALLPAQLVHRLIGCSAPCCAGAPGFEPPADLDRTSAEGHPPFDDHELRYLLIQCSYERPDFARIEHAIQLLTDLIVHAPRSRSGTLLALLAWAWWMRGMQTLAAHFAEESLAVAPDDQLCRVVREAIDSPPEWPFRTVSATHRSAAA